MAQCPFTNTRKVLDFFGSANITHVIHLKKIGILRLVVESGNLEKAAQVAKVSPSTISKTLNTLEKIYRKPLITRKSNTAIRPTKEALELLEWASPVFDSLNKLNIRYY